MSAPPAVALYVHVPFCRSRCAYCAFVSSAPPVRDLPGRIDAFRAAALRQTREAAERGLLSAVPSVYFGGGTPSALGHAAAEFVAGILGEIQMQAGAEITFEANPDSLDAELLDRLIAAGVNRFSLGVQSFDDAVLSVLGRCHDAQAARAACRLLAARGVAFSVDLICGIPGLADDAWERTVREAAESGAAHVSVYSLAIEEGTALAEQVDAGRLAEPDPDVAARQMLAAESLLAHAGFERYEIASYARAGARSRHNTAYWTGAPYLGIGPGAASMMPAELVPAALDDVAVRPDAARVRFTVDDDVERFGGCSHANVTDIEWLTAAQAAAEDAMLGLRMSEGIDDALAARAGALDALEALSARGLVEYVDGRWRLTGRGWLLGNEVFAAVLG